MMSVSPVTQIPVGESQLCFFPEIRQKMKGELKHV